MTGPPPESPPLVPVDAGNLQNMNAAANQNASPVQDGVAPCERKSWFSIRVIDDKDAAIEGLTLKLKIPTLGDIERITSKAGDPVKIEQLAPGGTGSVTSIDSGDVVWEALGDIT